MNPRTVATTFGALLFAISVAVHPGHAEWWHDPEPPLTWDGTMACELVVLARYNSHREGELTLRVSDVLKGKLDAKQPLVVKLAHLYSVETGLLGWDRFAKSAVKDDKIPKVCYQFRHFPIPQRTRALQAYLGDVGKAVAAPQK